MKCRILEARKRAISAIINSSGGCRQAAELLQLGQKKFENHAYENASSRPLTDSQIHQLEKAAGTTYFPAYIAGIYGGLFVPLVSPEKLDNVELYTRSVNVAAKRGTVDQIIARSLADGSISSSEADQILTAHSGHIAARHEEVLSVIELHSTSASAQL
ncbi:YmfL family putative regulatory protein [Pseudomonas alliivorans]|nr:YmfL family putative regulatory protein [Pseudomonas alliivorans]